MQSAGTERQQPSAARKLLHYLRQDYQYYEYNALTRTATKVPSVTQHRAYNDVLYVCTYVNAITDASKHQISKRTFCLGKKKLFTLKLF